MSKTSGPVRLLLKAISGLLLAGAIGFVLLMFAYLALGRQAVTANAQATARPQLLQEGSYATEAVPFRDGRPVGQPPTVPSISLPIERKQAAGTAADRRAVELAAKIRGTKDDAERAKLREQLLKTLGAAFDERRERQREAIGGLEKQLDQLRDLYEQRGERKEEIIQRRLSELLAEPDVLAWDPATAPDRSASPHRQLNLPESAPTAPAISRAPQPTPGSDPFGSPTETPETDPFGRATDPFAEKEDDPFGTPPATSSNDDPFGGPVPSPRTKTAEENASRFLELEVPAFELRAAALAGPAANTRGQIWGFGDLNRILELLAEISRLEAVEPLNAPSARHALQLARAKLEIAELDYGQNGQQLRARVESAETLLEAAERRLNKIRQLHRAGATADSELESAMTEVKQAEAALESAELLLEGRKKADAILQNYRTIIDDAKQASDANTTTTEPVEQEPATIDEEEAETVESETGEP